MANPSGKLIFEWKTTSGNAEKLEGKLSESINTKLGEGLREVLSRK